MRKMVKKTPKTDSNEIRNKIVHIAFTESEKEKYKKYAKESNETLSNFIRLAIEDKVRIIENPEKYQDISYSEETLREIKETQKKQLELQQELISRINDMKVLKDTFNALKPLVNSEEIKKYCQKLVSALKLYKQVSFEQALTLVELEEKDKYILHECIASNDKLEINENGEVCLIE